MKGGLPIVGGGHHILLRSTRDANLSGQQPATTVAFCTPACARNQNLNNAKIVPYNSESGLSFGQHGNEWKKVFSPHDIRTRHLVRLSGK